MKRDNLRANGVGQSVIRNQYENYLEYSGFKFYVPDETKPDCIVVDIDGTVAQMHDRSAFEWDKVENDKPCQFVIDLILAYAEKHKCKLFSYLVVIVFLIEVFILEKLFMRI